MLSLLVSYTAVAAWSHLGKCPAQGRRAGLLRRRGRSVGQAGAVSLTRPEGASVPYGSGQRSGPGR